MSNQLFTSIHTAIHWQQQVSLLQQISISQQTVETLNTLKISNILKTLLTNPRSKVITTTINFLMTIITKYKVKLYAFITNMLKNDILFKLLNSSNKIIFQSTCQLFKTIITNCPHQKMYSILIQQLTCKNIHVRQCISQYLLLLSTYIQFPHNYEYIIKNMHNDRSPIVRNFANQLQQTIKTIQNNKISKKMEINNKENIQPKQTSKLTNKTHQFHQLHQHIPSNIINNTQQQNANKLLPIQIVLQKLSTNELWNTKIKLVQTICYQCHKIKFNQKMLSIIFNTLLDLLHQKRSKINILTYQTVIYIIDQYNGFLRNYLNTNFCYFVEKVIKYQPNQTDLLSQVLQIDPSTYLLQLAHLSTTIKPQKQKLILINLLLQKTTKHFLPFIKVSPIIKILCKHIQKYFSNKTIYLPCITMLSHYKNMYNQQFFNTLLCLQSNTLNKILSITQNIDHNLKDSIIDYIHFLKGKQKHQQKSNINQQFNDKQLLNIFNKITNQQQKSVIQLSDYIFMKMQQISSKQLLQIIKLTQKVTKQNTLLQLQLLLQQISKYSNQKYLIALFMAISLCDTSTIQVQYAIVYLKQINQMIDKFPQFKHHKQRR